jgi:Zn-dependent protease
MRGVRRWSWRVGSIAGFDVRIHATFVLLALLVAGAAATAEGPGPGPALLWLVPLFASVLVHELAHSLVARRLGVEVTEIDLLPLGGISKMARTPDDPGVELRIALAGPLASVALAAACALGALLLGAEVWPPTLYAGHLLARLAWVNLVLGAFNLLPALPLDGGRVYEAALEQRIGRRRAMARAALVARDLAVLLVLVGLLASPLLLIVGAFVYVASKAEAEAADLHEKLSGMTVGDVMQVPPVPLTLADLGTGDAVLSPDDPLESSGLLDHDPDVAVVVRRGEVVGIATAAAVDQLVRRLAETSARGRTVPPPPPPDLPRRST